jgi:phosphoglycolate phosphatase-like HAD superfamily hydrolase
LDFSGAIDSESLVLTTSIEILSTRAILGRFRHALFDFDGTISTIREGWERVMTPLMIEMIAGDEGDPHGTIRQEVERYVDESTGLQTILQMDWLAKAVARHRGADKALSAERYKAIYNERLLHSVRERLARLERGEAAREELMIVGAEPFLRALGERGVRLYVASGTDVEDVRREATALGVAHYFQGGIFGAVGASRQCSKAAVIRDILTSHKLEGPELLVVGDGPVEIREGKARGAVTLGVASDEVSRRGLNPRKRERLIHAGADILIPDFTVGEALLAILFPTGK